MFLFKQQYLGAFYPLLYAFREIWGRRPVIQTLFSELRTPNFMLFENMGVQTYETVIFQEKLTPKKQGNE